MLIPLLTGGIGLVCLGLSIFLYKKYKGNHKLETFVFSIISLLTSLSLITIALKYAKPI